MMALFLIISFVTTDIYEKVKIRRLKCILAFRVYADSFPKTLRFFTNSFNQANDVYVKIYETAQLNMFKFKLTLQMCCGLHFQFRRTRYPS
jgi:hypothetical protein